MSQFKRKYLGCIVLAVALGSTSAIGLAADVQSQKVPVYVNQVLKPYSLIKKISVEVYVLDAESEEDAELKAFRKLLASAEKEGADGVMEVKRYILKDNLAVRASPSISSSMLKDDIDATGEPMDEITLDTYERGKGTLSSSPIDQTFDRSKLSEKVIRFTGKAIKFN